jgi:hypothetical protein
MPAMSDPTAEAADPSAPPAPPDPFAGLKRYDEFAARVNPLAAEFWAKRQPLLDALLALRAGPSADPVDWAGRLMAAGVRLKDAGLAAFPAEMANRDGYGPASEPEAIAEWTAWLLLAAAVDNDSDRVGDLLSEVRKRPKVGASLVEAFGTTVVETCLGKWRCVASPRYTDRLRAQLDRLQLTPMGVMEWVRSDGTGLSPGARSALRSWLWSVAHGRPIAITDACDTWGPDVPGLPLRRYVQYGPVATERLLLKCDQIAERVRAVSRAARQLTGETLPPIALPPGSDGRSKAKGKNIDARMLKTMTNRPESCGWTANQWAEHLHCAAGTVKGTKTWKERLKAVRAMQAADSARRMATSTVRKRGGRERH